VPENLLITFDNENEKRRGERETIIEFSKWENARVCKCEKKMFCEQRRASESGKQNVAE